jgi:hypothetical protein
MSTISNEEKRKELKRKNALARPFPLRPLFALVEDDASESSESWYCSMAKRRLGQRLRFSRCANGESGSRRTWLRAVEARPYWTRPSETTRDQ